MGMFVSGQVDREIWKDLPSLRVGADTLGLELCLANAQLWSIPSKSDLYLMHGLQPPKVKQSYRTVA